MLSGCLKESVGLVRHARVSLKFPRSFAEELNQEKLYFGLSELYFFSARSSSFELSAKTLRALNYAQFTVF
jgi:hypothetical protein